MMDLMFLLVVIGLFICLIAYVARKVFENVSKVGDYMDDELEEEYDGKDIILEEDKKDEDRN